MTFAADRNKTAIILLVANVEKLVKSKAVLATHGFVGLHIVQLSEQARKCHMSLVVKSRLSKDQYTILYARQDLIWL